MQGLANKMFDTRKVEGRRIGRLKVYFEKKNKEGHTLTLYQNIERAT